MAMLVVKHVLCPVICDFQFAETEWSYAGSFTIETSFSSDLLVTSSQAYLDLRQLVKNGVRAASFLVIYMSYDNGNCIGRMPFFMDIWPS